MEGKSRKTRIRVGKKDKFYGLSVVNFYHLIARLEEEEQLLNAESYYKKALNLDETFQEAEEALIKVRKHIQVILYFLLI